MTRMLLVVALVWGIAEVFSLAGIILLIRCSCVDEQDDGLPVSARTALCAAERPCDLPARQTHEDQEAAATAAAVNAYVIALMRQRGKRP